MSRRTLQFCSSLLYLHKGRYRYGNRRPDTRLVAIKRHMMNCYGVLFNDISSRYCEIRGEEFDIRVRLGRI